MSYKNAQWITGLVALVLATPKAGVSAPIVVYDNTTTAVSGSWTPNGFWPFNAYAPNEPMGDEITLTGTDREITEFGLILSSSQPETLSDLNLTLYANDGLDGNNFPGAPGTVLWTGTVSSVVVSGTTTVAFNLPNVVVPDTFSWTTSANSGVAGMATYDPPTIGSSGDYWWDRDSGTSQWFPMWFQIDPVANFGAKVMAVPEPTALVLLALGGLSAVWRRRR